MVDVRFMSDESGRAGAVAAAVLGVLRADPAFVVGDDRSVSNRRGPGERVFADVAVRTDPATRVSPLAAAEAAKRHRDLASEVGALLDGERELTSASWYPAQAGDVVLVASDGIGGVCGETYVVEASDNGGQFLALRYLGGTGETAGGWYATDGDPDPLMEMWFEAGPSQVTVIRGGLVVHGRLQTAPERTSRR